jgi:hypothetical protein
MYLISRGALDWGPAVRGRRPTVITGERTTESTIRRIGRDAA